MDESSNHFKTILFVDNYYVPFILGVGGLGSIASALVFGCSRRLRTQWSSVYLTSISIARCLFIVLLAVHYLNTWHYIDRFTADGWCQIESYLTRVAENLPVLIAFAFSIDAFLYASNPLRHSDRVDDARRCSWILRSSAFAFVVSAYVPFATGIDEQQASCLFLHALSPYRVVRVLFTVDSVAAVILPTIFAIALNVVTCARICGNRRRRRQGQPSSSASTNAIADVSHHIHRVKIVGRQSQSSMTSSKAKIRDPHPGQKSAADIKPTAPNYVDSETTSASASIDINGWQRHEVPIVWKMEPNLRTNMTSCVLTCLFTVPYSVIRMLVAWEMITSTSTILAGYVLSHMLLYTQLWLPFFVHLAYDAVFRRALCTPCCN